MLKKIVSARIIKSTTQPNKLSLRGINGESIRDVLTNAEFEENDDIVILTEPEALLAMEAFTAYITGVPFKTFIETPTAYNLAKELYEKGIINFESNENQN